MDNQLILVNETHSRVGEGPVWDWKRERFLCLDIIGQCFWVIQAGQTQKVELPQQVGCMAICENGDLLLAMEDGVYRMGEDQTLTKAHQEITIKGKRFNDGKVGPDGAFYLGTSDDEGKGGFYRLKQGVLTELFDGCTCSNGLDWTRDGKLMYYIDTPKQKVELFDFDVQESTLSNRRDFAEIPMEWGKPDGMTLDADENLWIALWNGHKAIQMDKNTREIKKELPFPCPKVSCCTFGGKNLDELYITTAAMDDLKEYPRAGNTYKITDLQVKGMPIYYYQD